jgi:hypothetical protein
VTIAGNKASTHSNGSSIAKGQARVLRGYRDDDGFRLGEWGTRQRANRARDRLSSERRARLEAAGLGLDPMTRADKRSIATLGQYWHILPIRRSRKGWLLPRSASTKGSWRGMLT